MRPDEVEALAELQWSGQDALGLALQGQTEDPGRRIEQDADAFRKKRTRRNSADDILDIGSSGHLFRRRRIGDDYSGYGLTYNDDEERHEKPYCHRSKGRGYGLLKEQREKHSEGKPKTDVEDAYGGENKHTPEFFSVGRKSKQCDPQADHQQEN